MDGVLRRELRIANAALEVAALYAGPYQLLRSTVDIAWIAAATATAAASRRTLGNRAGSRGTS